MKCRGCKIDAEKIGIQFKGSPNQVDSYICPKCKKGFDVYPNLLGDFFHIKA